MRFDLVTLSQGPVMTLMMKMGRKLVNNGHRDSVPKTFYNKPHMPDPMATSYLTLRN